MCAIFGALLNDIDDAAKANRAEAILSFIITKSRERGRDGFGLRLNYKLIDHVLDDTIIDVECRQTEGTYIPILSELNQTVLNGTIIGNYRAEPTTEWVRHKRKYDQQPYRVGAWSVVHNGTIANDKELRTHELETSIDSAAIAEALAAQEQLFEDRDAAHATFYETVKKLVGSYAIIASNEIYKDQLSVAVNYRPVWYAVTDVGVFFASSKEYFPKWVTPVMIEPYTVSRFYYHNGEAVVQCESLQKQDPRKKPRALVVASGGLDSTVAAAVCLKEGYEVTLLHFDYGCRATKQEEDAIFEIGRELGVDVHNYPLNIYSPTDSRLFDKDATIAGGEEGAEFAHEWVPARNLVMLSVATAFAEAHDFDYIVLGNNMEEAGAYPDNEPEFIRKFNELLPFAVGDGKRVRVLMPVGDLMKHEIVKLGHDIGAPMHLTWSCYKNGKLHCGKCGPCYMRRKSFVINEIPEVILYEE